MTTAREQLKLFSTAPSGSQARTHMLSLTGGGSSSGEDFPVDNLSINFIPKIVVSDVVEESYIFSKIESVYDATLVEETIEASVVEEVTVVAYETEIVSANADDKTRKAIL